MLSSSAAVRPLPEWTPSAMVVRQIVAEPRHEPRLGGSSEHCAHRARRGEHAEEADLLARSGASPPGGAGGGSSFSMFHHCGHLGGSPPSPRVHFE